MSLANWMNRMMGKDVPEKTERRDFLGALASDDFTTVFAILKEECSRGDAHAMAALATLYKNGRGVPQSDEEAAIWYRQAAVRGHVAAQAMLGLALANGTGTTANHDEAAYWLFRCAKDGCEEAAEWLADLVLQVPEVVGKHFNWEDITAMMKARGRSQMLRAVAEKDDSAAVM